MPNCIRVRRRHLVAGVLLVALSSWAAASARPATILEPGEARFWTGPYVRTSSESWTYKIEVAEDAYRLRVAVDHPEVDDAYSLDVRMPSGGTRSADTAGGLYSAEVVISDPPPGTYVVTVHADQVTDTNFRLRAKLEEQAPLLGAPGGEVLPNLQMLPPHEATFMMPVTNGATGEPPQGADLQGAESCHPEEHAEDRAVRCLRFAFGVRNTGRGPMDLFYEGAAIGADRPLYQRIYRTDGSFRDRLAGTATFHKTHGHYHHSAAVGLQLFKVSDRKTGDMEPAGEPRTKGFAHREELLREWETFYPTWQPSGFGLGPGWADIYEWDRPGNYIDFGLNGDGFYVIRMQADPVEGVVESNEQDNRGYTYFRVIGSRVKMLEAGRGRDPWDPCKIVVGFGGHPDPNQTPRPSHCPPDTV